jgi:hypothetical protein
LDYIIRFGAKQFPPHKKADDLEFHPFGRSKQIDILNPFFTANKNFANIIQNITYCFYFRYEREEGFENEKKGREAHQPGQPC